MALTTRLILDIGALAVDPATLGQKFSLGPNTGISVLFPDSDEAFNIPDFAPWNIHAFGNIKGVDESSANSLHSRYTFAHQSSIEKPGDSPVPVVAAIAVDFKLKESHG